MKYYTTVEQSNRLVELNIPVDTADMSYILTTNKAGNEIWELQTHQPYDEFGEIPCWSTEALLKLLPRNINTVNNFILNNILVYPNKGYCISYRNVSNYEYKEQIMSISDTLLECAYEMIVKLKEMKLI